LDKGDVVEVNYEGRGSYYPAKIVRVRGDGAYDVEYESDPSEQPICFQAAHSCGWSKEVSFCRLRLDISTRSSAKSTAGAGGGTQRLATTARKRWLAVKLAVNSASDGTGEYDFPSTVEPVDVFFKRFDLRLVKR
jgi:hypothetical protein